MFSGDRVSVGKDDSVLKVGCPVTRIDLTLLVVPLKMVNVVNFMLCVFYRNLEKQPLTNLDYLILINQQ